MSKRPTLRFKGRYEDWEQQKIGEFSTFSKGAGYSKADIRTNGVPLILYGRLYTKYETVIREVDTFAVPKEGSVYSHGGEVIVPASGESAEDISIASVVENSGLLLGGDLNIITPSTKIDPAFLALSISHGKTHFALSKLAQGKTIVHIHNADIQSVDLLFPKKDEQKDISGLFIQLDDLIIRYQRKYDKLLTYKKAILEKMFPKDGADVPEVRFAGHTKPWQHLNFGGEIVLPYSDPVATPNGGYERLGIRSHAKGTFHSFVPAGQELETAQMHRVKANNFIVNITFGWEHAVAITDTADEGKLVSHRFPQFSFNQRMVPSFFKYQIIDEKFRHHLWLSSPGGAGRNRVLNINQMLEYRFWVTEEDEQNKIAHFFGKLDEMIELQHEKLIRIKNIKKALLEKMFV